MIQTIRIHAEAPQKPATGKPCNGCGVCCVVEPCSVGRFFLRQRQGPCGALEWNQEAGRYICRMMITPSQYIRWLPVFMNGLAARLFSGWLAAGEGCDSDSEILD